MIGPLDITDLEKGWRIYKAGNLTGVAKNNLVTWMGERMGRVLQEIRILRIQVGCLQTTLEEERRKRQESEFDYMMDVEA